MPVAGITGRAGYFKWSALALGWLTWSGKSIRKNHRGQKPKTRSVSKKLEKEVEEKNLEKRAAS